MRVLTLDPGTAGLKAAFVVHGDTTVTEVWTDTAALAAASRWGRPDAVSLRFPHGGSRPGPVLLDHAGIADLERLVALAPPHQESSVRAARLLEPVLPGVPVVACFDTSFHCGLPEPVLRYALPRKWTTRHRLRRYGFHGLSCRHALRRAAVFLDAPENTLRLVCVHWGADVSVTAISGGVSVDTSMGFTPIEGAVSSARSGSVDPGLLLHVLATGEVTASELNDILFARSGLAGMTGTSGDIREVLSARAAGNADAELALAVYLHRLKREIGAAVTSLDRLDAVVFTGGVAEHQASLLAEVLDGLGTLGVHAVPSRVAGAGDRSVSADGALVTVLVVAAREDLELARGAQELLSG
jgi:acetate kinase